MRPSWEAKKPLPTTQFYVLSLLRNSKEIQGQRPERWQWNTKLCHQLTQPCIVGCAVERSSTAKILLHHCTRTEYLCWIISHLIHADSVIVRTFDDAAIITWFAQTILMIDQYSKRITSHTRETKSSRCLRTFVRRVQCTRVRWTGRHLWSIRHVTCIHVHTWMISHIDISFRDWSDDMVTTRYPLLST